VTSFEIDLDGTTRVVAIDGSGPDRFRVIVDGQAHTVRAVRAAEFGLSMFLEDAAPAAGTIRDVQVTPGGSGELLVTIGGRTVVVTVNGRRATRGRSDAAAHAHGAQSVVAPMPGRVVRVLVGAGDEVAARQGVVVVEAMKMENELRAPKAGKVREVAVTPGTSVEAGRVLMVIE
jgi:acetyl/propionyl-CoA carboxylase alpha subunit